MVTESAVGAARIQQLKLGVRVSNEELWWSLCEARPSKWGEELLRLTRKDAELQRVEWPVPIEQWDLDDVLLHPRFAVEQLKGDGSTKVRPIDNLSWSAGRVGKVDCVNGHIDST